MQSAKLLKQLDDLLEHKQYILESCNKMSKWLFKQGKDDLAFEILDRAILHDNSKIEQEELQNLSMICDSNNSLVNPKYEMTEFDRKCIELHWKNNRHHPEYFNDISEMEEIDILEMVCDWYARSKQLNTDLLEFVFTRQKNRFNFTSKVFNNILLYCYILLEDELSLEDSSMEKAFTFFHSPGEENDYLSNWYKCTFTVNGTTFTSGEQYMMYSKALLFKDYEIANDILNTDDFGEIKALGRKVRNFDSKIWDSNKIELVHKGLIEKFRQNESLKHKILSTGNSVIAECAVNDRIWGIGLGMRDTKRLNTNNWTGQNLLGIILMQIREEIRKEV